MIMLCGENHVSKGPHERAFFVARPDRLGAQVRTHVVYCANTPEDGCTQRTHTSQLPTLRGHMAKAKRKGASASSPSGGDPLRGRSIVSVAVADLIPYARNARTHSEEQVAQIAGSIREFGWTNPVLIKPDRTLIAGHGRVLAARKLGLTEVPAIVLSDLTDAQVRALVIADNKIALNAGWDFDMLAAELSDLNADGIDLGSLGFDKKELEHLISKVSDKDGADGATELDASEFETFDCQCPKCGFEFNHA